MKNIEKRISLHDYAMEKLTDIKSVSEQIKTFERQEMVSEEFIAVNVMRLKSDRAKHKATYAGILTQINKMS